ncbi:MAG: hypothetical protein OXM02_12440 [Bacteroidota bacterium]|nr:hypothetical protein [Bacteroidota bacterium]
MARTQEGGLNVELARVLRAKHPRWRNLSGEQTDVLLGDVSKRPDIVVPDPSGQVVIIETEYAPASTVEDDALSRLGVSLRATADVVEQVIAVQLPSGLRTVSQSRLEQEIDQAAYRYCVFSGAPLTYTRFPALGWITGGLDDLANCIELAALSENRVREGIERLETGIIQATHRLRREAGDYPDAPRKIAAILCQQDSEQTIRMAMAIVANAMTFHHAVAGTHGIDPIGELRGWDGEISKSRVQRVWRHILHDINYWPVFKVASDILALIRDRTADGILTLLHDVAAYLDKLGANSQHDLSGRMFQRLITDRKLLATYYTLPSSAALLSGLAVSRLQVDWTDAEAVTRLRVADFACGTGTLLNAAYTAIQRAHRRAGGDDASIHAEMIEHVLVGSDIMPAATHLTASILSGAHPTVPFRRTAIITLPYGRQPEDTGRGVALGALDLMEDDQTVPIFGTGQQTLSGSGAEAQSVEIPHESFDFVIMNPPFTRPTGHEGAKIGIPVPSFAGFDTPADEQRLMSSRLKVMRQSDFAGNGNAGLASNFIDVAHKKIKRQTGIMAMVLPAAFLSGRSWRSARQLLARHYRDLVVLTIANDGKTAFSADTSTAEVLLLATRNGKAEAERDNSCLYVNLDRRPRSILEAMVVSQEIRGLLVGGSPTEGHIRVSGQEYVGNYVMGRLSEANCAGVRNLALVHAVNAMKEGELYLPRLSRSVPIPITSLCELGERGLYHMDISGKERRPDGTPRGPFDVVELREGAIPTYPALWGSWRRPRQKIRAEMERQMTVAPGHECIPRAQCEQRAGEDWKKTATRLHFNRDFGLSSQSLAACLTREKTIGGTAWPNFVCRNTAWEMPMVLWANTTLGLIAFWWLGTRQHGGRSRVSITLLPELLTLDPRKLSQAQLRQANDLYGQLEHAQLLPANEAYRDKVRQQLDEAFLVELLGLPSEIVDELDLIRRQWCAEPSVHGGKKTAIIKQNC